jgi:hypothetical protein
MDMDFKLIKEVQSNLENMEAIVEEFSDVINELGFASQFSPNMDNHKGSNDRAAEKEWRANPKGLSRKEIQDKPLAAGAGNPKQDDVIMDVDKNGKPHVYALGKRDSSGFFSTVDVQSGNAGPEFLDKNIKKHYTATKGKTGKMVWKKASK